MRKPRSLAALLCCALLTMITGSAHSEEEVETSAKSAILIEQTTGQVLLSHNAQQPLPMASTTKVMTALMALEYGRLDEMVTVSRNAYGVPGTSIYLDLGEQITLHDLLYGLMLASGNDAAVAIAEHIGGDVDTFCRMMTQRAAELGCRDTVFINPNGLPVQGHHTTAYDLALIAREAMSHELFRQVVSTQRASIPWQGRGYSRILNNKNRLLASYEGATGIKTGYTKAAGRCLVFGARRDGMEVLGVVLNCSNWFDEAARLMDTGFEKYEFFTAFSQGETVRVLPVVDGTQETVCIQAAQVLACPLPKGTVPVLAIDLPDEVQAGLRCGETVGRVVLLAEGKEVCSVPLIAGETLARRDYAFELERVTRNWILQGQTIAE
ncbi:MAG: D-alanyl-D-alanine carboxypeptidase [Clostridia bacterium]|nr:D-alanyl-D-alanine carboxypeptidase [Clostridia bacterium]